MHNSVHNYYQPDKYLPDRWSEPMAEYAEAGPAKQLAPQPHANGEAQYPTLIYVDLLLFCWVPKGQCQSGDLFVVDG